MTMTMTPIAGLLAAILVVAHACTKEREAKDRTPCPTWKGEIEALFEERCVECHGRDTQEGRYALSTYEGVLGSGSDEVPNAIAGDRSSQIITAFEPSIRGAGDVHPSIPLLADPAVVEDWVVRCELAYSSSRVHEHGIMNPSDSAFHGRLLEETGWNFRLCSNCHGDDLRGGRYLPGCTTCHTDGPTSCGTCHDAIPKSGLHRLHVEGGGDLKRAVECGICHVVPHDAADPGHILDENGTLDPAPAEVTFSGLAVHGSSGSAFYDSKTARCANVYCHGEGSSPSWFAEQSPAHCDGCHGVPPANHGSSACKNCHPGVADDPQRLISTELHLNGTLEIGRVEIGTARPTCSRCHGSAESSAPPPDFSGAFLTTAIGVGAHQSHIEARHRLRGPIECSGCHAVPENVASSGHIDDDLPAEVFAPDLSSDDLARADGADPKWDRDNRVCSNVYCHGGGARSAKDLAPGQHRAPDWTRVGSGELYCGSCHGIPPVGGTHDASLGIFDCNRCHGGTVDRYGNIIIDASSGRSESRHINGRVDL